MDITTRQNTDIDPFEISKGRLLAIAFPKVNSKNFPMALDLAKRATHYGTAEIGGTPYHVASFEKTKRDAILCDALLKQVKGWNGMMMFSDGIHIHGIIEITLIIGCYLKSQLCRDPDAHCITIINDPDVVRPRSFGFAIEVGPVDTRVEVVDQYAFPCSLLLPDMKFQRNHPASYPDQIQAAGVESMCHICPRFDPDNFKKAGTITEIVKN